MLGVVLSAEVCSNPAGSKEVTVPEDLGVQAAHRLLEEIYRGGCADSCSQSLAALHMCLGPADVSKFMVGPLSPYTVQMLKHIKEFFDLMFKLETWRGGGDLQTAGGGQGEEDGEEMKLGADKVLLTCVGVGYTNLSKRTV